MSFTLICSIILLGYCSFQNVQANVCPCPIASKYVKPYTVDSITRDTYVIPIHSHNDYWRSEPLFDALRVGAKSIEADIWLLDDGEIAGFSSNELYIGHSEVFLKNDYTFNSVYLDNLWNLLHDTNDLYDELYEYRSKYQYGSKRLTKIDMYNYIRK